MSITSQPLGTVGLPQFEALSAAVTSAAKGLWAINTEATGYSQKSIQNVFELGNKLSQARQLDEIMQIHSDFAKAAFDDFTAQATKIGGICADMANETLRVAQEGFNVRWPDQSSANAPKPASQRKPEAIAA